VFFQQQIPLLTLSLGLKQLKQVSHFSRLNNALVGVHDDDINANAILGQTALMVGQPIE
jgi:hypothetical protein